MPGPGEDVPLTADFDNLTKDIPKAPRGHAPRSKDYHSTSVFTTPKVNIATTPMKDDARKKRQRQFEGVIVVLILMAAAKKRWF